MSPTRSRKQRSAKSRIQSHTEKTMESDKTKKSVFVITAVVLLILGLIFFATFNSHKEMLQKKDIKTPHDLRQLRINHQARTLSTKELVTFTSVNMTRLQNFVQRIMIVRPPGSANIALVKEFIDNELRKLGNFQVAFDVFEDQPPHPYPRTTFKNIIASTNPSASQKLVLACHYDSKIFPFEFVGATDSAAPCAMLLEIANLLNGALYDHTYKQLFLNGVDVALELVFFDGEEAFVDWTSTDSIYGARHLAALWNRRGPNDRYSKIDQINLFVLLDLIGHRETSFVKFNYWDATWYEHAQAVERRLRTQKLIGGNSVFQDGHRLYRSQRIEDDHLPFARLGVPIMHLISVPFPRVWHTQNDNGRALDYGRIMVITKIISAFAAEYLNLQLPPK